jgi:hypothetical protein
LTYRPAPRDTNGVVLPKPIEQLTELLAKNTHDKEYGRATAVETIKTVLLLGYRIEKA